MIFVKNSRGGREVNMINTLSKMNLSKIGWEGGGGVNFNLNNVFKYIGGFFRVRLGEFFLRTQLNFVMAYIVLIATADPSCSIVNVRIREGSNFASSLLVLLEWHSYDISC